jgi:ABC-type transporter Mla maintaining outer membrane lipid asymmetry ATPase subunit MlaF
VTHDVRSAFQISNRIALLHDGKIKAEGTPEELLSVQDEVVQAFLDRDLDITLAQLKRYRTHGSSL